MSTAIDGRRPGRLRSTLQVVLALALVVSACTSEGDPDPDPGGTDPVGPSGSGTFLASAYTGQPLTVRLSAGAAQSGDDPVPIPLIQGEPLDDDAVASIFNRLPEWLEPDSDLLDFNRPADSLTPPRTGETIDVPFPAGGDDQPPDVPSGPLEVLRYQPEGPVDVAPFISITFNQPMVPLTTLEQLNALAVPANITPVLPGRWQWIGTRTLRFESDSDLFDRLPMATDYLVTIPAGTTSQTGGELARAVSWEFTTPPVQIQSFEPQGGSQPLEPVFLAVADQRIDPTAVLETVTLTADGEEQTLRLATEAEIADDKRISKRVDYLLDGRWIAFRAIQAFEPDTALEIRIGPNTPSAEGPRRSTDPEFFTARTYAPLHIDDWSCRSDDRCDPGRELWIGFNNPLDTDTFDPSLITIKPELAGMTVLAQFSGITIRGATVGGTTYTATLSEDIQDIYGQTLGRDETVDFEIDDARPYLNQFNRRLITLDPQAPDPSLAVTTVNHEELRVRLFSVEVDDWDSYIKYWERQWEYDQPPPLPDWSEVVDTTVDIDADDNELVETTIDLSKALRDGPGHVVVLIEPAGRLAQLTPDDNDFWSNRPTIVWAQSTAIGADAFSDRNEVVVWATDLGSGEPLSDVEMTFADSSESATTNIDGLARLNLPAASVETGHLIARLSDDSALIDSNWERNTWFDQSVWYVFDDRQMYRPGETAHFKGWVRRLTLSEDAQLAAVADNATIEYQVNDWYGNEIGSGKLDLNALGGFDFEVDIPAGANLGQAWINFTLDGAISLRNQHSHTFQIQEFRRPEFEVTARTESAGPYIVGKPATVAVDAAYFSGGPLPNAEVEWTVTTRQATYSPPNWNDFTFGVWIPWWFDDFFYAPIARDVSYEAEYFGDFWPQLDQGTVETFSGRTDANGTHFLQMDFDGDGEGLPTTVSSEATVFDVNRQAWSSGTDLLVHPGDLYVGLRSRRTFVKKGEPLVIEAIVTDIDGNAVDQRAVAVEAGRLEWRIVDGNWEEGPVEIQTCEVTSAGQPVVCEFATEIGGTYQITATVTDDSNRTSRTELTRWVSGGNRRPERNVVQEEVTLIPDRQEYSPGDKAEILVEAPFSPAEGLVTISRNGFVSTETFTIEDTSTVLSIPIEDHYVPNVHIQVDLVGATERTNDSGDPLPDSPERAAFAVGRLNLQVPPFDRTLAVTAEPLAPTTEPGENTQVDVTVANATGAPVAGAELAVIVVDEAVLALSDYQLPDPLEIFYRPIESRVSSRYLRGTIELINPGLLIDKLDSVDTTAAATSRLGDTLAPEAAFEESADDGADFAAGGRESAQRGAIDVRTNFDALAVFDPEVRTDSDGMATIDVPLPDNLTRYRVMVVAVDGNDQFGLAESNITARLPLMVRPSAPRFLNFGDQFELPVVIQNQTDRDLEVDVVIQTANLSLTAGSGRRVVVPADDRIEIRFPAAAEEVGTARFRVAAVSGALADAATVSLPVYTPATTEAFATYGVIDEGAIAQPVLAPQGVFPQFGGLEINTSSTALQALTDAIIYLNDYRYESSDALASRILAISALRDVLEAFEADGLPSAAELDARVAEDIKGLLQLQTDVGGFAIWRRTNETIPYHSIQATHALVEAKANGYPVDANRLEQALWYLTNIEDFYPSTYGQQTRDTLSAYALHVRNLAGDRDSSKANDLYRRAGSGLGLDAVAWLWPVLDDAGADAEIERLFQNRVTETAGAATFATNYGEDAYLILHSDRRTDGIILDALIARTPDSDLIPKVVAGLLGNQTRGRWNNVQENSFILLALNNYFDSFEAVTPDFVARIWLGDLYAAEHVFEGRTTDRDETVVPMAELIEQAEGGKTNLVISKDGEGRLYYRLGLRYAPEDLDLEPLDRGFVVQRVYEPIDDPDDVTRDADGTWHIKPGAEVRVRLTMVADSRRTHVALIDPLPAGLEALNPELAVTGPIPPDDGFGDDEIAFGRGSYWWWQWFEHQNLRDDRAEAFASLLWAGTYEYTYVARATTPGTFVVPPTKAEEIYAPETFGRSGSDVVIVESS
jgi:uncharacterized protein YfaS (alpha-2-macroglobulin family)